MTYIYKFDDVNIDNMKKEHDNLIATIKSVLPDIDDDYIYIILGIVLGSCKDCLNNSSDCRCGYQWDW